LNITDTFEEGEDIFVVSSPYGLEGVTSTGIISAIHNDYDVQISTPISMGSSGAPIINKQGEVIGIVRGSLINGQNLNFGIAMKNFRAIVDKVNKLELDADFGVGNSGIAYPPTPFKEWVQTQNMIYTIDDGSGVKSWDKLGSVINVVKDYTLSIFSDIKKNFNSQQREEESKSPPKNFKNWFKNSIKAITDGSKEKVLFRRKQRTTTK